jgi:superfamily II DNA or RNA helicase
MGDGKAPFIVDNRESDISEKVQGYLHDYCEISKQFDIATGYFEVGALKRLDGEWQKLDKIRILMGTEVSKTTKEALIQGIKSKLSDSFEHEREKYGNEFLDGIDAIVNGIRTGKIECRVFTEDKFHAKMYITYAKNPRIPPIALVGSSNFTIPGISQNIELNVKIEDSGRVQQLQEWFDYFWTHENTQEVTEDILEVMEHESYEYEPFLLYGKSLEEYFRDKGTVGPNVWHKSGSVMWPMLDKYQKDGYQSMLRIAGQWNGAFLCDGVGLGKTYVGLMLIERLADFEGKNVLLLTPKSAHNAVWEPELKDKLGKLLGWGTNFLHMKHTDLTLKKYEDNWEMAKGKFDAIIIDEAHHFRNRDRQKHEKLLEFINQVRPKEVFFLTATPINNSVLDLKNMIDLFIGRDDKHFARPPLAINSMYGHFRRLKIALNKVIESEVDGFEAVDLSSQLAKKEAAEVLQQDPLVRAVVVQRSRGFVRQSQMIHGGREIQFPIPQPPNSWNYRLEEVYGSLLDDFETAFAKENPLFNLSIYYPYKYYRHDLSKLEDFDFMDGRLKQIGRLIRIGMLKAFESSVYAFEARCNRLLLKLIAWLSHETHLIDETAKKRLDAWMQKHDEIFRYAANLENFIDEDDEEQDDTYADLPKVDKNLWGNEDFDVQKIIDDTYEDLNQLISFIRHLRPIQPIDDSKLQRLIELIQTDAASATGKVIIFSEFKTTARYLERELKHALPTLKIGEVDSNSTKDRTLIVKKFSPYYNKTTPDELAEMGEEEIDILVSTDVLSEGLNLQDSTRLINYDIHWNPVRLMQRIGRIDRRMSPEVEALIISNHPERESERGKIAYWNFLPPDSLDNLINLYGKVTGKMVLISKLLGIQHGHGLDESQTMDMLIDLNEDMYSPSTTDETLKLKLDELIKNNPDAVTRWRNMPFHTFSGKSSDERKGVFFCYRIPGPPPMTSKEIDDGVFSKWVTIDGIGESRWYFYDLETEEILDGVGAMGLMHNIIECEPTTERSVSLDKDQLKSYKKKVQKHIKNTALKALDAPMGTKPRLVCWISVN